MFKVNNIILVQKYVSRITRLHSLYRCNTWEKINGVVWCAVFFLIVIFVFFFFFVSISILKKTYSNIILNRKLLKIFSNILKCHGLFMIDDPCLLISITAFRAKFLAISIATFPQ